MKSSACLAILASFSIVIMGCASVPAAPTGSVRVSYSQAFFDGSSLKDVPTEIRIVQRETTGRAVAAQVGLNVLMLALGGGAGFSGFSKNDLAGDEITDVQDRANLVNPVSTEFVTSLQAAVDERMAQEGAWKERDFRNPMIVGGGRATLVYDTLTGSEEPLYQLALGLDIYKRPESSWIIPARSVQCSDRSQPAQPLAQWAESSYAGVQQELNRMLHACQEKVLARLPELLEK